MVFRVRHFGTSVFGGEGWKKATVSNADPHCEHYSIIPRVFEAENVLRFDNTVDETEDTYVH